MATMKQFEAELFHTTKVQATRLWDLANEFINIRSAGILPVDQDSITAIQALAGTKDEIARAIYNDPESWITERAEYEPACECGIDQNREAMACKSCQCAAHVEMSEVF